MKTELHHWWPQTLSRRWADEDGNTTQIRATGERVVAPPKNFGAITNAHHVRFGGPWSSSLEPSFAEADAQFHHLIDVLSMFKHSVQPFDLPLSARLSAQPVGADFLKNFASPIASLVVRSPQFRNSIKLFVDQFRPSDRPLGRTDNLYPANISGAWQAASQDMITGGGLLFLFADSGEFIYGDGHFNDFNISSNRRGSAKCIVPLLPKVAAAPFKVTRYNTLPKVLTMVLSQTELEFINFTTQIYSRDVLFSRSGNVRIYPEFQQKQFLIFECHSHDWLDYLWEQAGYFLPPRY
jgi:hypothetical protein